MIDKHIGDAPWTMLLVTRGLAKRIGSVPSAAHKYEHGTNCRWVAL